MLHFPFLEPSSLSEARPSSSPDSAGHGAAGTEEQPHGSQRTAQKSPGDASSCTWQHGRSVLLGAAVKGRKKPRSRGKMKAGRGRAGGGGAKSETEASFFLLWSVWPAHLEAEPCSRTQGNTDELLKSGEWL